MWHLSAFEEAVNVALTTAQDLDAVPDEVISIRNSHLILTDPFDMIASAGIGTGLARARFNAPHLNTFARNILANPPIRGTTIPADPNVQDNRDDPIRLPMLEEIAVESVTDTGGTGTEQHTVLLWLAPRGWSPKRTKGKASLVARFTQSITTIANGWTVPAAPTFAETLRSGEYALMGLEVQVAGPLAYRVRFPKSETYNGRILRPGGLTKEAIGNKHWPEDATAFGEMGRFHSFELFELSLFSNGAAAETVEGRAFLEYLRDDGGV